MFRVPIRFIAGFIFLAAIITPANANIPDDCNIPQSLIADIRLMLTAEDNQLFDLWTNEEVFCACAIIYYTDPPDADFHDRVMNSAVIRIGKTGDPRAVAVLIDAIETHPHQALYALGDYRTPEALRALTTRVSDPDGSIRENAAEGLRNMLAPAIIPDGWIDAISDAIAAVDEWLDKEPDWDVKEYFVDAKVNLEDLLKKAQATAGTN
ncbi:MAG TPA: HEAT repeat domain-containing protein [Firmicutes bacterium]|nr:HEAT repeat domain-containing protein [Bacillota bacterium]